MVKETVDNWMSQLDKWLWEVESAGESKTHKSIWHIARVMFAVIRDVLNGHITLHAMSLVYTTLLSIVPLLAFSFLVLRAFGIRDKLQPILEQYLMPFGDQGNELISNILTFVENINYGVLGSVGLGVLIYTIISLVQKVERSFNEIWRVTSLRSFGQRFSNYLSVIMVGPLLAFTALGATATLISSDIVQQIIAVKPFGWLFALLGRIMPYCMIIGLFTFLYTFIPNTKVQIRHAFVGGIVAGILWQTASLAFTIFVANSGNYTAIYQSFAVIFLFLLWLSLSWLILLIGASVSFYSQHAQQITRSRVNLPSASVDEQTGLTLVYHVAHQFDNGGGGASVSDMESNLSVGPEVIQRITKKLIKHGILVISNDGNHLYPAYPLDKLSMRELIQVLRAPEQSMPLSIRNCDAVTEAVKRIDDAFAQVFQQQTVADWIRRDDQAPKLAGEPTAYLSKAQ